MPMSEDVAGATISMTSNTISGAVDLSAKTLEALLRLLQELNTAAEKRAERKFAKQQMKQQSKEKKSEPEVVQKDMLQSLKMKGKVSLPELREYAAKNDESIVYSEQGLSKDDVALISKNARQMGIPIAFSRGTDKKTYYPSVSSADAQPFKIMLQGIIADKLNADRQKPVNEREYAQLAVAKWELPFISQECQRLDIQGSFAPHPTERNQVIFVYRKQDEDAALSITDHIEQSCKELKDVKITPDSEGFVTVRDDLTGQTYSFDASNTSEEVMINELQDQLGFDSMKAKLTAAKFENECLTPDQIEDFKQDDPHNAFYSFGELYIPDKKTGKESQLTSPYRMGYYACKYDNKPCFSLSNPQGKTVVFSAREISRSIIRHKIAKELGVKNKGLLNALTDKVDQCARSLAKSNMSTEMTFQKTDFDLSDPNVAAGMRRTDASGNVFVKKQPLESLSLQIARTGKKSFIVTSTVKAIEFDESGNENAAYNTRELESKLRDSRKAYEGIKLMLVAQGVPLDVAKSIAREAVTKAQSQPEKDIVYMDRVSSKNTVFCFTSSREAEIPIKDGKVDAEKLQEAFDIPQEDVQQTQQRVSESVQNVTDRKKQQEHVDAVRSSRQTSLNDALQHIDNAKRENIIICNASHPTDRITVSASQKEGWDTKEMLHQLTLNDDLDKAEVIVFETEQEYKDFLADDMTVNRNNYSILDLVDDEDETIERPDEETADDEVAASSSSESADSEVNGHEQHPEGNILNEQSENEVPDILGNNGGSEDTASAVSDVVESLTDDDDESMSIGAR